MGVKSPHTGIRGAISWNKAEVAKLVVKNDCEPGEVPIQTGDTVLTVMEMLKNIKTIEVNLYVFKNEHLFFFFGSFWSLLYVVQGPPPCTTQYLYNKSFQN